MYSNSYSSQVENPNSNLEKSLLKVDGINLSGIFLDDDLGLPSLDFSEELHFFLYLKKKNPSISTLNTHLRNLRSHLGENFISECGTFYMTEENLFLGFIENHSYISVENQSSNNLFQLNLAPKKRLIRLVLYPNLEIAGQARDNGGYKSRIPLSELDYLTKKPSLKIVRPKLKLV